MDGHHRAVDGKTERKKEACDRALRQLPLPENCAIQPMAEEVYDQEDAGAVRLISIIAEIDTLLTEHHGGLN